MGTLIALLMVVVVGALIFWFLAAFVFVKVGKTLIRLAKPFIDNLKDKKEK